MPELPEVETVRRGLEPVMTGKSVIRLEARRPDLRFPLPERMSERLAGRTVEHLGRRSKYLVARMSGGDTLIMHLGMSGRFTIGDLRPGAFTHETGGDPKHDHVVFEMSGGHRIVYNDPRRFGFMLLLADGDYETHPLIANLGVEPLGNGFTSDYLAGRARGRSTDLKTFLMDQRNVAGLGNIYVAEALFRAGLSPNRRAQSLATVKGRPTEYAERLVSAIRTVLTEAVEAGGSTLRDYRSADGALGYFQHRFLVYGRDGEACARPGCRGIVRRSIKAGRSTFACSTCQR
ncbi:MAG: bifunctional DNA-formamidopyrimidine glycosylase/DNA-(apurinic or apyrimidinic site) lyase [Hyphomicrobiaceae bacterium]|nr:bifunctional DNA-formamidopyrimidine glycosylase/DNA-(apurinic or apyrimidinic site) lyase [Hyphomicrobiaceae bacterium]